MSLEGDFFSSVLPGLDGSFDFAVPSISEEVFDSLLFTSVSDPLAVSSFSLASDGSSDDFGSVLIIGFDDLAESGADFSDFFSDLSVAFFESLAGVELLEVG